MIDSTGVDLVSSLNCPAHSVQTRGAIINWWSSAAGFLRAWGAVTIGIVPTDAMLTRRILL
jgi:hypothetical protein